MFDCLIKNGIVVDGTGAARREADVAILDGRIAEIGRSDGPAKRTLDARGRVVAPGFVDIHTHYDAQAFWDGTLSPSPFHGVTTVVGGIGFSIAPLSAAALPEAHAGARRGCRSGASAGVPWTDELGEYLARLDGRLAERGFRRHSALRRCDGEAAIGEPADAALRAIDLLRSPSRGGSASRPLPLPPTTTPRAGPAVAIRDAEEPALARVREFGTTLEFIPRSDVQRSAAGPMVDVASANRPLSWNVLGVASGGETSAARGLDCATARGAGGQPRCR
jgi:hypothetical protein